MPGFVSWVPGIVSWVSGIVFWVSDFVFWLICCRSSALLIAQSLSELKAFAWVESALNSATQDMTCVLACYLHRS